MNSLYKKYHFYIVVHKVGITLAILSLSGNMPVFKTWWINRAYGLMVAGSIIFRSFEEVPSQLFLLEGFLLFYLQFLDLHP